MEAMCVFFLWTRILFAALATIEVLRTDSQGFRLDHDATVVDRMSSRSIARWNYNGQFRDPASSAHDRSSNHHTEDTNDNLSGELAVQHINKDFGGARRRYQLQKASTLAEIEVLMAFKEGVTSDSLGALTSWKANDSDACHWKGVSCTQGSKRIIALELDNLQLVGTISPLLGDLTYLQKLDLSSNVFNGEVPISLLNCSHLSDLALSNNNLTGEVPSQLGNLLNLRSLDLSSNLQLAGDLPATLGNSSFLRVIHLQDTSVGGQFPDSLGRLAHLQSLNLSNTLIYGTVPKALGNCSSLTYLYLGNLYATSFGSKNLTISGQVFTLRYLEGELPAELGQLTSLINLGIGGTNIGGPFPSWIANLTKLTGLLLIHSFFTGEIPDFLGQLPLEILALGTDNFTGTIPKAISNCSDLWFLTVESNPYLTGAIPPELGSLGKLGALYLDSNNLTGMVPSSLSNCSALRGLDLGNNPFLDPQPLPSWVASFVNLTLLQLQNINLIGEIPVAIGQMVGLTVMEISDNQLNGVIPASLGNCTSLIYLDLWGNQLHGELPSEIWQLRQLEYVWFGDNLLTGPLSASIGNWSQIQELRCDTNHFSGGIPSQVGSLQNLLTATFDDNNFDGAIPQSLGNCSALAYLTLSQNRLSGSIPASLGNLTALEELFAFSNQLEGQIPVDLMRCSILLDLDLSQNLLVGSVPEEIGQLVYLQSLQLHHNKLSSALPQSLGFCKQLLYVDLSFNTFHGAVPGEAIADMSAGLYSLNVSHNLLSGALPEQLEQLTVLYYLDFSANNFSGAIPSGLQNCLSLVSLDLSMNDLSGGIPQSLGQLPHLAFVNMSYNHLEGPLPDGGIFNSSNISAASFLGNPKLCGASIFLKECPADRSAASASSCRGFRCDQVRIALASVGAAVAALIVLSVVIILHCRHNFYTNKAQEADVVVFASDLVLSAEDLLRIIEVPENRIGVGESSIVYEGVLNEGRTIAIKVLRTLRSSDDDDDYAQAEADLYREARTLSKLKHRNILKVLGMLSNQTIKALILEFMPGASLHQQLYDVDQCLLSWDTRLNIALGVAEGLVYLHNQAHEPVIHRDLKPSNIFLDTDLEPKVGDFGLSRFVKADRRGHGETTASTFRGTVGYIPPEYATTTRVSTKGDVYSYGVILLELLTRKHPIMTDNSRSELEESGSEQQQQSACKHLVDWVLESSRETPLAVLDPMLLLGLSNVDSSGTTANNGSDENQREQMKLLMQVGLLCTQTEPQSRPQMSDVLCMVRQIKERGVDPPNRPSVAELAHQIWRGVEYDPDFAAAIVASF